MTDNARGPAADGVEEGKRLIRVAGERGISLAERHHVGTEHRRGAYLLIDLPLGRELPQVGGVGQLTDQ